MKDQRVSLFKVLRSSGLPLNETILYMWIAFLTNSWVEAKHAAIEFALEQEEHE